MRNCVTIQLKKDEIWIKIKDDATEEEIIESLNRKLDDLEKLYQEEKTPIKIKGKTLKNKEMEDVKKLIKSKINVNIDFEIPTTLGLHGIKKAFSQEIKKSETKFHRGSLRSGQRIEFEGSLVIIGDVNAGAEVVAEENIVILGDLRGLAHAGAKGNVQAIIAANKIDSPQIRIADKIKEFENKTQGKYSYAFINENDGIVVE